MTGAGPGSQPDVVKPLLAWIQKLIKKHGIKTINDAGCGRQIWIPKGRWGIDYQGYDLAGYSDSIKVLDITKKVMRPADLIICKDVFRHLTDTQIESALDLFDAKLILCDTEPGAPKHIDADTPIDMTEFLGKQLQRIKSPETVGNRHAWFKSKWFAIWEI